MLRLATKLADFEHRFAALLEAHEARDADVESWALTAVASIKTIGVIVSLEFILLSSGLKMLRP